MIPSTPVMLLIVVIAALGMGGVGGYKLCNEGWLKKEREAIAARDKAAGELRAAQDKINEVYIGTIRQRELRIGGLKDELAKMRGLPTCDAVVKFVQYHNGAVSAATGGQRIDVPAQDATADRAGEVVRDNYKSCQDNACLLYTF